MQNLSSWAKGHGAAKVAAMQNQQEPSFMYSIANFMVLKRVKAALGLDQCEAFFFGAAPLKMSSLMYFASLDIPLFNVYGMSETSGACTASSIAEFDFNTCGKAIPGTEVVIANPDENGEGEILMRGRNIMMGYLRMRTLHATQSMRMALSRVVTKVNLTQRVS